MCALVITKNILNEYVKVKEEGDLLDACPALAYWNNRDHSNATMLTERVSNLMQNMNKGMKAKGYSALTIKAYRSHLRRYLMFCIKTDTLPKHSTGAALQSYSLHLLEQKFTHSYVNQAISAIQFYRRYVVGLKDDVAAVYLRPKKENKLPNYLIE